MASQQPPLPVNLKRIGRYEVVRPLSKGGMALVFEARRKSLAGVSPRVAIKIILPQHASSKTFRDLFINEARVGASMHHQNLVQIQDFDQDENGFFIVMEYVEGITLSTAIRVCQQFGKPVPLEVIAELGRQACDGLDYAHTVRDPDGDPLDLVHRDIKPSNLILTPHGVVKILDFGIALANLMPESKGAVRGTWGYMAPEQAAGRVVNSQADIFGLGAVLLELARRGPLFAKKDPETVKRLLDDDHAARMAATLDPEYRPLVGVLVRALQRDPAARYRNAAEFGRELSSLLPDPVTVREQLSHFYDMVSALKAGRPVPAMRSYGGTGTNNPATGATSGTANTSATGNSIVLPTEEATSESSRGGGMLLGLVTLAGVGMFALLLVAGLAALVTVLDQEGTSATPQVSQVIEPSRPPPGAPTPKPEAIEEPAPAPEPVQAVKPKPKPAPAPAPKPALPEPVKVVRAEVPEPPAPEPTKVVVVAPTPAPAPAPVVAPAPEPEPEPAPATGPGVITVSATIPGSEVYIDGRFVRKVPLIEHELPAGEHTVGITAPNGLSHRFRVMVVAGESTRWNWDFDRQEFKRR
ncbi:MAG: PEGA domain-containing protein [Deltaproteobacteria bacterium]|nr:MAG: PEGA domain-containing protein [Deltaproteobacteria bacterium]